MDIRWKWLRLSELTAGEMHEILAARQSVFVVEQKCAYQDADLLDFEAWHLTGRDHHGQLVAYLRINVPGSRFAEPSLGRLLTVKPMRGKHLARQALHQALSKCGAVYPGQAIRIAAQTYLVDYYRRFGFRPLGKVYEEDGIAHIDMIRPAQAAAGST